MSRLALLLAAALAAACSGEVSGAAAGGGAPGDGGAPSDAGAGGADAGWGGLYTQGNHLYTSDGRVFHGRGANIHDTRSCWACAWAAPDVAEVKRRVDLLVDGWKANFLRLVLESYSDGPGTYVQWKTLLDDPQYLADITEIVDYIGTKPGVQVLVSVWHDPNIDANGWPTAGTDQIWAKLADVFALKPHVLYGIINEPENNFDGAQDPQVWTAMNRAVGVIRAIEDAKGTPHHVVTVQGTGGWARRLGYYVDHPITAGGGQNVAYEVHVYNPPSDFPAMVTAPAAAPPVVIGEVGPSNMTEADCTALMNLAESLEVPYLAWTFHMRCPPNLLVDNSGGGCGVGMTLAPTSWGTLLKDRMATPW